MTLTALREAIANLGRVLPAQPPIKDFVTLNILEGYQHLPFRQAVATATQRSGAPAYMPLASYREYFRQQRITTDDLRAVIRADAELRGEAPIVAAPSLTRQQVYLAALINDITPRSAAQLDWEISERQAVTDKELWAACLQALGLQYFLVHAEDLTDLPPERAEEMFTALLSQQSADDDTNQLLMHRLVRKEAERLQQQLWNSVGTQRTLRGLLQALTGEDILETIRPHLIRHAGAFLDLGVAAWHHTDRDTGFYTAWRQGMYHDLAYRVEALTEGKAQLDQLPPDAFDAIVLQLQQSGLALEKWGAYIETLALEMPGWAGMFCWRQQRPGYAGQPAPVSITDYLAVRLCLERLAAQRLCQRLWQCDASLPELAAHFEQRRSEFMVRYALFNTRLPEYLVTRAERLVQRGTYTREDYQPWEQLSDMIWTWRRSPLAERAAGYSVFRHGWQLYRLVQLLELTAEDVRALGHAQLDEIFACIDRMNSEHGSYLWQQAFEYHFREQVLHVLDSNRQRIAVAPPRASAQLVFCMDDREESFRRQLEEIDPRVQTFGAAGFFGVAMNWQGLDDTKRTPLCPVVITPAHQVTEQPETAAAELHANHVIRHRLRQRIKDWWWHGLRRRSVSSAATVLLLGPLSLLNLLGRILLPVQTSRVMLRLREMVDLAVPTRVDVSGFTDNEQAERIYNFLRMIGLIDNFAPLVLLVGHGSTSQNNPHLAVYDCGACSGRHGGPNARVFAAMANRPEVRALLRARGIDIPEDSWFIGCEHNTCNDQVSWFDLDLLPMTLQDELTALQSSLEEACAGSAQERSRRFMSVPADLSPLRAWAHVLRRSMDFSQSRPELGHACNACAVIGRRRLTRGAFFDRRMFLISYDPEVDSDGRIIENILSAAGPVSVGINLAYYFSAVNNDYLGSGTKVVHNVTGLHAVMEGASSDLRSGLPRQMIEIHEPMRLSVIVEARTDFLLQIIARQPIVRELADNHWMHLTAIDPASGAMRVYVPGQGFVDWQRRDTDVPVVACSQDWYRGEREPLPPVLLQPAGVAHG